MGEYLSEMAEIKAFRRQFFYLTEVLQKEHNMSWESIEKHVFAICDKYSPYASGVVTEFMKMVERPNLESAIATSSKTKQQLVQELADLFINDTKNNSATPVLKKACEERGIHIY